jgi:NADH:ubiquinone oxidoreductase subunit E
VLMINNDLYKEVSSTALDEILKRYK